MFSNVAKLSGEASDSNRFGHPENFHDFPSIEKILRSTSHVALYFWTLKVSFLSCINNLEKSFTRSVDPNNFRITLFHHRETFSDLCP